MLGRLTWDLDDNFFFAVVVVLIFLFIFRLLGFFCFSRADFRKQLGHVIYLHFAAHEKNVGGMASEVIGHHSRMV